MRLERPRGTQRLLPGAAVLALLLPSGPWLGTGAAQPTDKPARQHVQVQGAVARPGQYRLTPEMQLKELIQHAGGLLPKAGSEARITRLTPDGKRVAIRVELVRLLKDGDMGQNLLLQDGDLVLIPKKRDYSPTQMGFTQPAVRIEGAILRPGQYPRSKEMRLVDLIRLAGGLREEAGRTVDVFRVGADGLRYRLRADLFALTPGEPNASPLGHAGAWDRRNAKAISLTQGRGGVDNMHLQVYDSAFVYATGQQDPLDPDQQ